MMKPTVAARSTETVIAGAIGLCLLAPLSHAQTGACSQKANDVTCVGSVVQIPQQNHVSCKSDTDTKAEEFEQLQSDEQNEAAARVRLAEARMADADVPMYENHADLEQNFDAARSHVSSDKRLDRDPQFNADVRCSDNETPAKIIDDGKTVEVTFDAPMQCLKSLQSLIGTDLPIAVDSIGGRSLNGANAKLLAVVTVIDNDTSSVARARAQLDSPLPSVLEGDAAVVRFQCR